VRCRGRPEFYSFPFTGVLLGRSVIGVPSAASRSRVITRRLTYESIARPLHLITVSFSLGV